MSKIIIGVHGLANKPPKEQLTAWWRESANEGLAHIGSRHRIAEGQLELAYWADQMYVRPRSRDEDPESPFFLGQPFEPGKLPPPQEYEEGVLDWLRTTVSDQLDDVLDRVGFMDQVADALLSVKLKDLAQYWDETRAFAPGKTCKEVVGGLLKSLLLGSRDHEILLIGHSMGSIVAFDALTELAEEKPDFRIPVFVTVGSPLGLPRVIRRAARAAGKKWPVVPANVGAWFNFADKRDKVAVDTALRDDYLTAEGRRFVEDDLILNQYQGPGGIPPNPHKIYGYLRCPELARQLDAFLGT